MVVLLLDLDEGLRIRVRCAVGAQPQLFLVHRLVERAADEPEIRRVIIDVADGGLGKPVALHARGEHLREPVVLLLRYEVFFLVAAKHALVSHKAKLLCCFLLLL